MAVETALIAVGDQDEERTETLARVAAEEVDDDGRVVVGYAFTEDEFADAVQRFGFDRSANTISPGDVADRLASVRAAHDSLDEAGVDTEVKAAVGNSGPEAFVRMSDDLDADRVVVGGDRRSPAGKAVFGSDAQSILLDAACPVVYVRGDVS
ncbi:MAG: universal stress protein UspA related nucleotide-binding protein [uncultured archaeon A07HB70]|nr:MAG: universal stress protein UspA related nucleotide-binding protein [uncultured archaeon A07HB70]